jgi:hypothetical protein
MVKCEKILKFCVTYYLPITTCGTEIWAWTEREASRRDEVYMDYQEMDKGQNPKPGH